MGRVAKKKQKRFDVTKAVKAASRANIGPIPATRRVPVKNKDAEVRHKATLAKILDDVASGR